jgi:hypothetical protein
MIQQVVARSDRGEHFPDGSRRRNGVTGAFRSGTDYEFSDF